MRTRGTSGVPCRAMIVEPSLGTTVTVPMVTVTTMNMMMMPMVGGGMLPPLAGGKLEARISSGEGGSSHLRCVVRSTSTVFSNILCYDCNY